ncbi:MAG: hypothetical protein EGP73_13475 [Alistipes indistinctus]|uniref:DUF6562 domain-containing protein n=1 Tax=Alistipes indistinctus TaxID=626932 RepID=UPI00241C5C18|nr:DUF6562 domain-containing protein [Alistipes indistinctus]MBD9135839.1 hypothetical protein [Alistipes indistinctus]
MKNLLLVLTGALLLLMGGCTKDPATGSGQGEVTVNLTASLPTAIQSYSTKASNQGGINNVTDKTLRYILEVYDESGNFIMRKTVFKAPGAFTDPASFSLTLLAQKYKFAFWADFVASEADADLYYSTLSATDHGLQAVALKTAPYAINDEARDAYTATLDADLSSSSLNRTVTLKRPFGKIRLLATDLAAAASQGYTPTQTSIAYTVELPTTFNALTGAAQASPTALPSATAAILDEDVTGGKVIALDYVFAGVKPTVSLTFSASGTGGTTERAIETIPVEANKLTTVKGALFTRGANLSVSVSDEFNEPGNEMELTEVNSIDEVATALSGGDQMLVVKDEVQESKSIDFSAASTPYQGTETVAVTLNAVASGAAVTFQATADAPKNLAITMPEGHSVTLNMPNTTVTLNGRHYSSVDAITATSTLIVPRDVTVENLTLRQGNVKIYGVVDNVTKVGGWTGEIVRAIANDADWLAAVTDRISDYALIETDAVINGSGKAIALPLKIRGNLTLNQAGITVTGQANAVTLDADNLNVVLTGVTVNLQATGTGNTESKRFSAILATKRNNVALTLDKTNIVVPNAYISAISMLDATDEGSVNRINIRNNSHVGPDENPIYIGGGNFELSGDQQAAFDKRSYSRGINILNTVGKTVCDVDGSLIEGSYYSVYTKGTKNIEVRVANSTLIGRAAFDIFCKGGKFNIDGSTLVGHNSFTGPTEDFAEIVFESLTENNGENYALGNTMEINNSQIVSLRNPVQPNNNQYGIDVRAATAYQTPATANRVALRGSTKLIDRSATMDQLIQYPSRLTQIIVEESVTVEGKSGVRIKRPDVEVFDSGSQGPAEGYDGIRYIESALHVNDLFKNATNNNWHYPDNATYVLLVDIDMNGATYASLPERTWNKISFDGQGHTISNFKITNKQCAALFANAIDVTVKNLTLEGATITATDTGGDQNAYAGGFIARCYGTNIVENCVLNNCTVQGINKVGGIVGFSAENTVTIKDCKVQGSTIKTDDTQLEHGQCGAILGYVAGVNGGTSLVTGSYVIGSKVEAAANTVQDYRHNGIYVGSFQGTANCQLTIDAPSGAVRSSTLNGAVPDGSKYQGLLGGVRDPTNLSGTTVLTINGKRFTE